MHLRWVRDPNREVNQSLSLGSADPEDENGGPKAAIKDTAKTASAVYGLISRTLFMNQVQINQRLVTAHRYIGIVFYQAGKRCISRLEI
jgi:hypothetical protein